MSGDESDLTTRRTGEVGAILRAYVSNGHRQVGVKRAHVAVEDSAENEEGAVAQCRFLMLEDEGANLLSAQANYDHSVYREDALARSKKAQLRRRPFSLVRAEWSRGESSFLATCSEGMSTGHASFKAISK